MTTYYAMTDINLTDSFWSKIDVKSTDECWLWKAGKNKRGYGRFHTPGTYSDVTLSHRWCWELYNDPLIGDECVLHSCDVPSCCNPHHLFKGTRLENNKDMRDKGRGKNPTPQYGT